jgi:hypothetical protein
MWWIVVAHDLYFADQYEVKFEERCDIWDLSVAGDRVGRLTDAVIGGRGELKFEEDMKEMRTKKVR